MQMSLPLAPYSYKIKPDIYKLISFLLITFVAFSFSVLAGCQSESERQSKNFPMMIRKVGVIRSLGGAKTASEGTHILQTEKGDSILLKAVDINLDDEKYQDKTIEVRGVWLQVNDEELLEVQNIDIVE